MCIPEVDLLMSMVLEHAPQDRVDASMLMPTNDTKAMSSSHCWSAVVDHTPYGGCVFGDATQWWYPHVQSPATTEACMPIGKGVDPGHLSWS